MRGVFFRASHLFRQFKNSERKRAHIIPDQDQLADLKTPQLGQQRLHDGP